jgi:hypothetical protein
MYAGMVKMLLRCTLVNIVAVGVTRGSSIHHC